jgi:hypothetical protein
MVFNLSNRLAGWSIILSAAMLLVSIVTLMIFFSLIPTQGTGNVFGPINDVTSIMAALLMVPMLWALKRICGHVAPTVCRVALLLGLLGALALASVQSLFLLGLVSLAHTAIIGPLAFSLIFVAIAIHSWLARRLQAWPRALIWLGTVIGLGGMFTAIGFVMGGVEAAQNILASVGLGVSVLIYPIWTVWFGHLLLANSLNSVTSWKS